VDGDEAGGFAGEEGREVLEQEHGPEGVDAEGVQRGVVVDLGGRAFGVEDARDGEREVEVVVLVGEQAGDGGGGVGDGRFVCRWAVPVR
jgi:hypothetical protein